MPRITLKLSTLVGEIFDYQHSQMADTALKLSNVFGKIFEYQHSLMAKITWLEKLLNIDTCNEKYPS